MDGDDPKDGGDNDPVLNMSSGTETIYSSSQLSEALVAGVHALKDQLEALAILDGSASSWPGVRQALDDLEFLVGMNNKSNRRLFSRQRQDEKLVTELRQDLSRTKDNLKGAHRSKQDLAQEVSTLRQEAHDRDEEIRRLQSDLRNQWNRADSAESRVGDLTEEVATAKQEIESINAELHTAHSKIRKDTQEMAKLKEDLAARNADVKHLEHLVSEVRSSGDDTRKRLDAAQTQTNKLLADLGREGNERSRLEKELAMLKETYASTSAELQKTNKEVAKQRDWNDVNKRIGDEKLQEAKDAHAKAAAASATRIVELESKVSQSADQILDLEKQSKAKQIQIDDARKQSTLHQLQIQDLNKQISQLKGEKDVFLRAKATAAKAVDDLRKQLSAKDMEIINLGKDQSMAEIAVKEAAAKERAKLLAKVEESQRESQYQRTLAEGWVRENQDLKTRLEAAEGKASAATTSLTAAQLAAQSVELNSMKASSASEYHIKSLQEQVGLKEVEAKKARMELSSTQKQLEKVSNRLAREGAASTAEIHRLKLQIATMAANGNGGGVGGGGRGMGGGGGIGTSSTASSPPSTAALWGRAGGGGKMSPPQGAGMGGSNSGVNGGINNGGANNGGANNGGANNGGANNSVSNPNNPNPGGPLPPLASRGHNALSLHEEREAGVADDIGRLRTLLDGLSTSKILPPLIASAPGSPARGEGKGGGGGAKPELQGFTRVEKKK